MSPFVIPRAVNGYQHTNPKRQRGLPVAVVPDHRPEANNGEPCGSSHARSQPRPKPTLPLATSEPSVISSPMTTPSKFPRCNRNQDTMPRQQWQQNAVSSSVLLTPAGLFLRCRNPPFISPVSTRAHAKSRPYLFYPSVGMLRRVVFRYTVLQQVVPHNRRSVWKRIDHGGERFSIHRFRDYRN